MIDNLYIFVPPRSSHTEKIESLYSGLRGIRHRFPFKWGTGFFYAGHHTKITDRISEDGATVVLAEGRLQNPYRANNDSQSPVKAIPIDKPPAFSQYDEPFSFVFIDKRDEAVWFVRDIFGLSTFYHAVVDDCILFSTNAKDILAVFPQLRKINSNAIGEYLVFNHIAGANTIFADIKQIETGRAAVVNSSGITIREIWAPSFDSTEMSTEDAITQIQDKLTEIVHKQFEFAPQNTGLLLSGGIDSSLLCAYLAEITDDLPTFSVAIPDYERSEEQYFTYVSRKYRTRHATTEVNNQQYAQNLTRSIWHMEEPLVFTNSIPTMLTCQTAKLNDCDWLLTGEGADGLFSGGTRTLDILARGRHSGSIASRYQQVALWYSATAYDLVRSVLNDAYDIDLSERLGILEQEARRHGDDNYANALHAFHLRTYSEKAPRKFYRMSAASSVVCVSPFLTRNFANFLFSIPFEIRNHSGIPKYPLVNLASKLFGEPFANRPKGGFNVPNSRWFRSHEGLGTFRSLLLEERTLDRGFYKPALLRKALLFRLESDDAPLDYLLWSVLNLELWIRMFIEGEEVEQVDEPYLRPKALGASIP
jgi:asparagine synthase (glutamine-hydrolysing)